MEIFKLISIVFNLIGAAAYCWMIHNNYKSNKQRAELMQKMREEHNEQVEELTIAAMNLNDKLWELNNKGGHQ